MKNCNNCGAPIEEGTEFCTQCGVRVVEHEEAPAADAPKPKSSSKNLLLVSAILSFVNAGLSVLSMAILPLIALLFVVIGIITLAFGGVGAVFIAIGIYMIILTIALVIPLLLSAMVPAVPGVISLLAYKKAFDDNKKSSKTTWAIMTLLANAAVYIDLATMITSVLNFPTGIISWIINNAAGVLGIMASISMLKSDSTEDTAVPSDTPVEDNEENVEVTADVL